MKKETYEKLGAKQFKKLVFKVEKIKWKIIKKLFPNYLNRMEKNIRKVRDKQIKKAKSQEEINKINATYKKNVMLMKKEYNTELNINYHLDINNPEETKKYLEYNKKVHKSWLKIDAVAAPILIGLLAMGHTWTIPLIAILGVEALKNFECINLQNYSIACLEEKKEKLKQLSIKTIERKRKKYGEAQDVITKVVTESDNIPNIDKVISEAKSKESLEQLRKLLLKEKENRNRLELEKQKVRGKRI